MLNKQGGVCAICKERRGNKNLEEQLMPVDHNHSTKKTRQILCRNCNLALGLVREDLVILKNMISYIEKHDLIKPEIKTINKTQSRTIRFEPIFKETDFLDSFFY